MKKTFADIPGWTFDIAEVSAGFYEVIAMDVVGRSVQVQGIDLDALLDECRSYASKLPAVPASKGVGRLKAVFPREKIEIRSPGELAAVISVAQAAVQAGDLRPVEPVGNPFATDLEITELPANGPWPDYLELLFEARDGRRYKLVAETYHGASGSWEPTA